LFATIVFSGICNVSFYSFSIVSIVYLASLYLAMIKYY